MSRRMEGSTARLEVMRSALTESRCGITMKQSMARPMVCRISIRNTNRKWETLGQLVNLKNHFRMDL